MVMSETRVKQADSNRNGRSPLNINATPKPPSVPADDLTPETSDDDSHSKKNGKPKNKSDFGEEKIRVGKEYQVVVPNMKEQKQEPYADKALLVWSPVREISESNLEEYVCLAKERYAYNSEQALGMLFWHKHDLERSIADLANFTPFPDEWSKEDKVLFEQAFQFHGKCFTRIRQMLPDKSIASLVKFYYSWKKTRSRTSVMDRQEKKKIEGNSENGSENGSPEDSDVEDKKWPIRGIRRTSRSPNRLNSSLNPDVAPSSASSSSKVQDVKRFGAAENKDTGYSSSSSSSNGVLKLSTLHCQNCTVLCDELKASPVGSFCMSCFHHWRRTGVLRPTQGPHNIATSSQRPRSKSNKLYYYQGYHDSSGKYKKKPPKGMYINFSSIEQLAAIDKATKESPTKQPITRAADFLGDVEREISVLYTQIQKNKQKISFLKVSNGDSHDSKLVEEVALSRVYTRWTKEECSLAIMGFRKYGQNFKAIAEVLGTKTESHVRKFFAKYRKSKNLDTLCQESTHHISNDGAKEVESIEIESDQEIQQVKIPEVNDTGLKTHGKTSIMTTSNGKTLKRKIDEDGDLLVVGDDARPEKKMALESLENKSEITLTPIPKTKDEKINGSAVA